VIEPDINERMARFSPSQVQDDVDPIASEIASRAAVPTSQPTMAMPDVDPVAAQIAEKDTESLDAAVLGARAINPDEAARAIKVGRKVGIPAEVARADMQRAEQQAYLSDLRSKDFLRTDPVMANFLANKEFAETAHDDIDVLGTIRPFMLDYVQFYVTGMTPGMRRGFERGQLVAERGEIGGRAMAGLAQPEDFERATKIRDRMRELVDVGFLGATTEVIAQNLAQIRGIGTFTVGGAALGSVVPVVGTVAGGALGATAGVVATTGQMEAGNLYLDLREEGVEDDVAIPVSVAGGFLNGVIEVVGMKIAAKPFQALAKRFMAEAVAKAVAQPTTRAALAAAGKGYILQVGTEASEEALQEVVIIAGEEIAKAASGIDSETGLRQATERVVDAFVQGAMGSAILGGIGPGANLYVDLSRAANTERQQVFFEKLATAGKDSRLAKRSPEAYERFLEAQAKDGPAETIYVDGRTAQELFAQSGLTAAQLEEVLPGIKAQVDEAVATGGDVTIQTARFGARLANTDLGNALLPHMRLDPDAMSLTEAQEFQARRQEVVKDAERILTEQESANGTFVQEAREIEDTLASQIQATGQMDERAARSSAQFMRDFYVTQAASMGLTPKQVYERFPVRVEGEGVAAPLAQAAMPPGPNAPSIGVAEENKLGFWPALRVMATQAQALPEKPLILTGTTNKNAAKQLANVDDILGRFPDAGASVDAWTNMLSYAFATNDVPVPPYAFIRDINGNGSFERLSTLTEGQIADASRGFANAKEFRQAYINGELDVITTGKLFLWSFLSRGVSPYTQESLFIDAFEGADSWIKKAAQGDFTEADFPAYEKWAKSVAPQGSGQPGAGATHNLNAFGKNFLMKMGAIGPDGKSNLQRLHEMMSDPNQTGQTIRREFSTFGEGVGIDNKVVSFTLLVAGFNDVMVLDRVQIRQLWDDGRFAGTNLYDGVMSEDGKKLAGSSLNAITEGVRGILVYEAIERQLASRVNDLYARLGRPEDASIGRYHWETWVAYSQQEAAHATLDAILLDAKGDDQAIAKVSGKQGEYGAYEYGAQYNRDRNGIPWFRYVTPLGGTYDFSVASFRQFLSEIKKAGNKVVPAKFKVSESGNAPWYTRPEVNQQRLEEQAAKWADRGGGTGEGARLVEQAAADADAIRARSGAGVQPAVGVGVLEQAAAGPARGGFDPRRLTTILNKTADLSTFLHESAHAFLTFYEQVAQMPDAPARIVNDLDEVLRWAGIAGDTPQTRLATWNGMTLDQKRKAHEQFAYSFEVYLFEGKAPSAEMQGLFERFSAWLKRVYRSIRDDLNAIYRREFGEDLPILTGEVRQVMDRMLATDEQIARQAAINEMKPMFQTQAESGMSDAEWAAYQQMQQEAIEASVIDMNVASMRQMQWLGNARSRVLREVQKKHDARRKEVAVEIAAEVKVEPVYRAMTYLRTGKFIDAEGNEIDAERDVVSASLMELARSMGGAEVEVQKTHRLDMKKVRAMYAGLPSAEDVEVIRATGMAVPTNVRPDIAKLGTGKNGMMGLDGLDPDLVAETFGYSSGDEMIRALVAARPMKEIVAERTDAEMLRRFGDMTSPEAIEAEVQAALHNEARARFVAVELRYLSKATEPARVMVDAAKQVARDLIAGKRVRDVRPSDFVAAEARAARDASRIGSPVDAVAVGRAAYTRTYNERIAAGADEATAVAEATTASVEAARMAQERTEEIKARYGADPEQARIRAKRAQLYQNQLAAEALRVKAEVDKQVKYLRRVLRDENVKRMGAQAADQVAGLLDRFEVAAVSLKRLDERKALTDWLAEQEAAGLVPDIAPEIANEARRVNYREMKVSEFRDLVDAVKQIEFIGKNEQKLRLAEERAAFEEKRDEIVTRIRAAGKVRGLSLDPRTPLTGIGRAAAFLRGFAAQHLKAASIARVLDGGKEDGPLWNAIIRTANDASDMETTMRAKASLRLGEILKPVFALGGMGGKGMHFPSIGRSLNREARLAIAMNMGNDGNRQRLLDGEGWTLEQIQPVLESLTEAEWQAVQQVWDFIDGYRPEIAAKERRLYGKEPEWVKPVPFTVRTVDGKDVSLQGGYYPIKYDPVASDRVATVDAAEEAKRDLQGAYTAATTRRSFVKARAKEVVDRPILYTLDAAFSGVNDVIHDLSWHEWLISTNRLLRDVKFANAVRETRGPEFLKQLRDWTKDNATWGRGQQVAGESVLSWLRQGISASGLGFNINSAIIQVTGFNQSIVRVGAKYIGQGITQFATSPFDSAKMVAEKSQFMAERGRTQFREINEIKNRVRGQTEISRRVFAGTYFLMMNMQRSVDIPTWLGAYQKALDAGKNDATAVALADQAVRDSQGSGLVSDLAAVERGGPAMKLFTVFYSYMNTVYNMAAVQTMTARGRGKLAADYAMLFVVPVVLGYAIKSLLQPNTDDEEFDPEALARKLAAEELSYMMGTMIIAREFGGAAQLLTGAEGVRMGYGGPAGLRAIGEVYGLATQAGQLEFDRAFRRSAVNTLGAFTGLPAAQINRTIDGIEAVVEGEVEGVGAVVAPLTGVQR
jgi:hypothetical protein